MTYKVIITGANNFVGEGILLECLEDAYISEILLVSRWENPIKHPKVRQLIIPDFLDLDGFDEMLTGFDACFYCASIDSMYLSEHIYKQIIFDITLNFAVKLLMLNPDIKFNYLSHSKADRTETSKLASARMIGRTEDALNKLSFKRLHHFRPGWILPLHSQKVFGFRRKFKKFLHPFAEIFMPNKVVTMKQIASAMINVLVKEYPERTIRSKDIKFLQKRHYDKLYQVNKFSTDAFDL
ncbi:MAG: hypothetical protein REI64_17460 [Pedobacter sp.]|uniref:hypothetical protein n=1 Tax=Pedobacter sp. TaxID=1411316 RepID=UPI002808431F|nr:hypothetical protein [Pedobacter sp.]MDQ8006595.1 hypothetical protein [Pedobacter sp.]